MNSTGKFAIGCAAGLIILCLVMAGGGYLFLRSTGWVLAQTINSDPNQVASVADEIADFELPDGFGEGNATQLADHSMVAYTGSDGHSHIYLFQLPAGVHLDQAEIERQVEEAAGRNDRYAEVKVIGAENAQIRGQEVLLTISQGVNHNGQPFREISGLFEGKGGQAFLVYSTPVESWDQATVDTFLASFR